MVLSVTAVKIWIELSWKGQRLDQEGLTYQLYHMNVQLCLLCYAFLIQTFIILFCSGESMENALRACCKGIKIGKILIHRDGDNGQQVLTFSFYIHFGFISVSFFLSILNRHQSCFLHENSSYMKSFPRIYLSVTFYF